MTDSNEGLVQVTQADRETDFAFIAALAECAIAHGQILLKADTAADMLKAADRLARHRSDNTDELAEAVKTLRDRYSSRAKFADHETAAYFRDFVADLDAALAKHKERQP